MVTAIKARDMPLIKRIKKPFERFLFLTLFAISYFNFSIKIQRAINRLNNTFDIKINIKTKDKIEIVSCKDIMYVEVFDNKLVIHMATKIIETIGRLYEIEQKLANGYISLIHTPETITIGDRTYSFEDQWSNLKIVINNPN